MQGLNPNIYGSRFMFFATLAYVAIALPLVTFHSISTGTPCFAAVSRISLASLARRSISSPKSAPSSWKWSDSVLSPISTSARFCWASRPASTVTRLGRTEEIFHQPSMGGRSPRSFCWKIPLKSLIHSCAGASVPIWCSWC